MNFDNYSELDLLALYNDADFYDQEFSNRDHEIPFYKRILTDRKSVLEVACGTGRITIPLKKMGINISGTDISPQMIAKAKENAKRDNIEIDFKVENAENTQGQYDAIFMATNAFQHLTTTESAMRFLQSCRHSLVDDGLLVIDLQIPDIKKLSRNPDKARNYKTFVFDGMEIDARIKGKYESITQLYKFNIEYYANNQCIRKKSVAMRMYYPQEIKLLFDISGFKISKKYGGHQYEKLDDTSPTQIYIIEKQ